jgi:predicted small secreted protein
MNGLYRRRGLAVLPLLLLLGLLYGCNTVQGMGEDLSALGRAITGASEKTSGSSSEQNR